MNRWYKNFHVWSLNRANTKWGDWAMFACAFADASFLPLPTSWLFIAMALLYRTKAYRYALFATIGTILGGVAGYLIGHFAWTNAAGEYTVLAQFLFDYIPGFTEGFYEKVQAVFTKWDIGILLISAALPIPYKIFSISSGIFNINLFVFITATLASHGLRFFLLALLTQKLGPEIKKLFEFSLKKMAIIATAGVAFIILVIKIF
jgi:membrane protein YqaA with SNARE-associated domain